MFLIALEGSSFAGKTTISNHLTNIYPNSIRLISEYVEYAKGSKYFPPFPKTSQQAIDNLIFFLNLDAIRFSEIHENPEYYSFLLDRSVLTLLAFNYALEKQYNIVCYEESYNLIVNSYRAFIPDLTIYLKIGHEELIRRFNTSRRETPNIFIDREFNFHFNNFFQLMCQRNEFRVIALDAERTLQFVIKDVITICNVPQ